MDAFQIEVMTRLWALQHVVQHVGKIACIAAKLEPEHMRAMVEIERQKRDSETFPGADPALSDHLAAEIGRHVDNLLSGIADDVAAAWRSAQRLGET